MTSGPARGGRPASHRGFTLLEAVLALGIAALVFAALGGLVGQSLEARELVQERHALARDARFAMERMVTALRATPRLLLPLAENPATPHSESLRDLLAVLQDRSRDVDGDGFADADKDRDGRVDEDPARETVIDNANGLAGFDDDGDGLVDEGGVDATGKPSDDDEDGAFDEDPLDGLDNDGDGSIDEDTGDDVNGDGAPGVAGFDDDGDGSTDEGALPDDDEDASVNEDGFDPVVFYLQAGDLLERQPDPHALGGQFYTEQTVAENVTLLQVERLPTSASQRATLVELTLELEGASGETVRLVTRVRVGGGT